MSTFIGIVLLAFGAAGLIVCVIYHASVLFFTVAFLLMLVGGVMTFDNGDPNGLKFPDVTTVFGSRGYIVRMQRLRGMVNQGLITEEEYEQRKKEYMRKYGMKKGGRQ